MEMATTRSTAAARRDDVLDAARVEFADHGYEGASTEDIARRAGISQPYLFRLFGTKKELFKASVARCFRETLELFQRAAEGKRGEEEDHDCDGGRDSGRERQRLEHADALAEARHQRHLHGARQSGRHSQPRRKCASGHGSTLVFAAEDLTSL